VHQRLTELIRWVGVSRILASAFGVIVMVVGVWWVVRVPPPPPESTIPFASSTVAASSVGAGSVAIPTMPVSRITVYVSGEVAKPGVYVLLPTARMIDAVQAAGGATSAADLVVVNLAAPLVDAAQVFIPRIGSTPRVKLPRPHAGINLPTAGTAVVGAVGGTSATAVPGIVDLNSASLSDLDSLPGVGPSTAQAIIDYRVANGPYASVDDLLNVRGIGPSKLAAMRARVRV
jgi:competence protein ComEA